MVSVTIDSLAVDLGHRTVLRDVSAAVQAGEFIGIIGPTVRASRRWYGRCSAS